MKIADAWQSGGGSSKSLADGDAPVPPEKRGNDVNNPTSKIKNAKADKSRTMPILALLGILSESRTR
jgi:hypothetical protein